MRRPGTLTHKPVDQGMRSPLRSGEKLADQLHYQLSDIAARREGALVLQESKCCLQF